MTKLKVILALLTIILIIAILGYFIFTAHEVGI